MDPVKRNRDDIKLLAKELVKLETKMSYSFLALGLVLIGLIIAAVEYV